MGVVVVVVLMYWDMQYLIPGLDFDLVSSLFLLEPKLNSCDLDFVPTVLDLDVEALSASHFKEI